MKKHSRWFIWLLAPLQPMVLALPALAAQGGEEPAGTPLLFSIGLGLLAIGLGALVGRWIRDRAAKSLQKSARGKPPRKRR